MKEDKKPPPNPDDATLVPENMRPVSGAHRDAAATLTPVPESKAFPAQTISGETIAPGAVAAKRAPMSAGYWGSPTALPAGTILAGRYEILQMLGEGGMGAVYKATDRELERTVALKVIRPELAGNPAIIQRFKQELILARQVTHRNVIRIYDLGEAEGVKFITMEYVEGRDLHSLLLERQKFTPEEAVDIMQQVCLALDAAHREGVIHRDLKPQNIMRDAQGRVVVMDFGLARSLEATGGMTQSGALIGTMEYMSPEQALGTELDQRSDLFTVGLIFYELLSGKTPYKADTALASLLKRTQERAIPVADLESKVPRGLSNVVSRCLERDLKLRYQTAQELLNDLSVWQGNKAAASLGFPPVRPWGQGFPWVAASVVLVVLLLAGTGYIFRDKLFSKSTATRTAPAGPQVSLAILPFRNASGDPSLDWLGPTLAEMLNTAVGHSAHLRTVSPDRVHQLLTDLRIGPSTSIDLATLARIAESSNADNVVSGQFVRLGDQIKIDATLQDINRDRRIPLKLDPAGEKDIPAAASRLAESIRQNLSVSPDVLKELKASSFQPSSKSPLALRDYNQGVQLLREGKNLEAVKSLGSATKEDPQFALAFSRLADANSALGYDSEAEQVSRKAIELAYQLPLAEKYLIEAAHARIVRDNKKAIEAYENLSKTLPDNPDVQYALGSLYRDEADYDKARALFSRILQADPKNIRTLWQMGAVEMMSGNPRAALDPLTKGLSLAIQSDNQEQKGLILLAMGISYRLMNKPDEALRSLQESLDINTKIGQKRAMASDLSSMAQVQALVGKSDLALTSFNRGLQIEREIGAKKEAGDTLIDLANLYLDRGQYQQALKMYKESLQIQRDSGDETNQALCLNNIGNVYLRLADYEGALTYLQQAFQLRQKLNVPPDIADTLHNLGVAYGNLGHDEQAMADFIKALDLDRKASDNRGAASQSHSMAFIFARQGRYGAAVNAMQDTLKSLRDAGDRSIELAQSLNDFGRFLAEAGRSAEAAAPLNEAELLARNLKNNSLRASLLNTRGDVLFYAGNVGGAKAMYQQALSTASQGGQPEDVLISKINLARAALVEGHATAAANEFAHLQQQADSLGQRQRSLECSVYRAEAIVQNKDYTRARQELQQILGNSEKLGMRMENARIHYLMGTSLRLSGNISEGADQYRQALRLLDDIKKEAGAEHLLDRSDLNKIYAEATRGANLQKT
ncbi:MAG TPA: tetratricopeptide repeat protein [Terriglobales bacterium]|nr:tetratricopeptide repeat protein [Terriglobales bacterium]